MKKYFIIALTFIAASFTATSCGDSNDDIIPGDKKQEQQDTTHIPVVSMFKAVADTTTVESFNYTERTNVGDDITSFYIQTAIWNDKSRQKNMDILHLHFHIKDGTDYLKWNGKYQITQLSGNVMGFYPGVYGEQTKCKLKAGTDGTVTGNSYANIEDTGTKDDLGRTIYNITIHIDEMTEINGDYVRNLDIKHTGPGLACGVLGTLLRSQR